MKRFLIDESGATAIEYSLICALIVIACVAGFTAVGSNSNGLWTKVSDNVSGSL